MQAYADRRDLQYHTIFHVTKTICLACTANSRECLEQQMVQTWSDSIAFLDRSKCLSLVKQSRERPKWVIFTL